MNTATIGSATVRGTEAVPVAVEVIIERGLPAFRLVGTADADAQESRLRVRAALRASGFSAPDGSVTVNLAPGTIRKTGTAYDLPIAVGILVATEQVGPAVVESRIFSGELGPDGSIRADGVDVYNSARLARMFGMDLARYALYVFYALSFLRMMESGIYMQLDRQSVEHYRSRFGRTIRLIFQTPFLFVRQMMQAKSDSNCGVSVTHGLITFGNTFTCA